MNVYQKIVSLGKIPDEYIGKNVISVFKSAGGHFGFGLFNEICHVEKENKEYKIVYSMKLCFKMLSMTFQEILIFIKQMHDEKTQENNKNIIKMGETGTMLRSNRKIQEKLGIKKLRGAVYETPTGEKMYLKYSSTRRQFNYSWFGIAPKQLDSVDFVVLICLSIEKSLVFPVQSMEYCGHYFQGLKELLIQGPTALRDGNWKLKVFDNEDLTFLLEGSGWKTDVSQYWSRFDLINKEEFYFEIHSLRPGEYDGTCHFCEKNITGMENSYLVFNSKPEIKDDIFGREIFADACSECAWSDKESLKEILKKRKIYHAREIQSIEKFETKLWPNINVIKND